MVLVVTAQRRAGIRVDPRYGGSELRSARPGRAADGIDRQREGRARQARKRGSWPAFSLTWSAGWGHRRGNPSGVVIVACAPSGTRTAMPCRRVPSSTGASGLGSAGGRSVLRTRRRAGTVLPRTKLALKTMSGAPPPSANAAPDGAPAARPTDARTTALGHAQHADDTGQRPPRPVRRRNAYLQPSVAAGTVTVDHRRRRLFRCRRSERTD